MGKGMTRRGFLRGAGTVAVVAPVSTLLPALPEPAPPPEPGTTGVRSLTWFEHEYPSARISAMTCTTQSAELIALPPRSR